MLTLLTIPSVTFSMEYIADQPIDTEKSLDAEIIKNQFDPSIIETKNFSVESLFLQLRENPNNKVVLRSLAEWICDRINTSQRTMLYILMPQLPTHLAIYVILCDYLNVCK